MNADPFSQLNRQGLLDALAEFDDQERHRDEWIGWEDDGRFRYALEHEGRWYPVKTIISKATGVSTSEFSGGSQANGLVESHGFTVKELPDLETEPLAATLRSILHRYPYASREGDFGSAHPIWKRFERLAELFLASQVVAERSELALDWSIGKGSLARIPWLSLTDRRVSGTAREGVYCAYLFREDMSAVCLTLMQGATSAIEEHGRAGGREILQARAKRLASSFQGLEQHGFSLGKLDLHTNHTRGQDYQAAAIAFRCYPSTELPDDEELLSDLAAAVDAYERFIESRPRPTGFGVEALEDLKRTFLDRLTGFRSFRLKRGLYWHWERAYKEQLQAEFQEQALPLIERGEGDHGWASSLRDALLEVLTARLPAADRPQNLLSWRYFVFLRHLDSDQTERFSRSFLELLRGEGGSGERIERFNNQVLPILESYDSGAHAITRSFPTLFLMLDNPEREIFVRTRMFDRVAKQLLDESLFESRPLGEDGYKRARDFAWALHDQLDAWGWEPQDMIDVQGFLWVVGGSGSAPEPSYWIFQGNPDYYDIEGQLRVSDEFTWLVNQHEDDIELGDRVFLWESGADAGILGVARIVDGPDEMAFDEEHDRFVRGDASRFEGIKTRVRLHVEHVLDERVSKERLADDPMLKELTILRAPQGTNFVVTDEQAEAIEALMRGERREGTTILKIAPGRRGEHWEECRSDDVILVGWNEVGDLLEYDDPESLREAVEEHFGERYNQHAPAISRTANGLWKLRELEPGDLVVANRGTSEVLAIGTVRSPGYHFEPEREHYQHAVSVDWDTSMAGSIPDQGGKWQATIVELEAEELEMIRAALDVDQGFEALLDELETKGFHFPPEAVANYLLALQTKRFVILTGISGTGKTRLAIETAKHFRPVVEEEQVVERSDTAVEIEVYPYMLKYGQMVVPVALASHIRIFDELEGQRTDVAVEYPEGATELSLSREAERNVTYLSFRGDFRRWFTETFEEGDTLYLDVEPDEEGRTQKLKIWRPRTRREKTRLTNYAVVDVHPDWTDNRGLLGYYNPITEQYQPTPFLHLLLRASKEESQAEEEGRAPHPFFVILDEMNLARVEHYFSDFLSALESEEAIHLHDDPTLEKGTLEEGRPIPRTLDIPGNVFFTGTVNVDETTYMFSPKVLDRAFTIELNRVDLRGYGEPGGFEEPSDALSADHLWVPLSCDRRPNADDWEAFEELEGGELQQTVIQLNELLARDNLHFGYRVANEIARFVLLATRQAGEREQVGWHALDIAVKEKVLPKFHGTEQELEQVLGDLFLFALSAGESQTGGSEADFLETSHWRVRDGRLRPTTDTEVALPEPVLPRTGAKLLRMRRRLRDQGFTSFIQ